MKKAEWLLIHYHDFQSRKNILQRTYSRPNDTDFISAKEAEEIIARSIQGSIITNDIPHDHSGTSRTEAVALSYKKIHNAFQEQSLELIQEIQQLDFCKINFVLLGISFGLRYIQKKTVSVFPRKTTCISMQRWFFSFFYAGLLLCYLP